MDKQFGTNSIRCIFFPESNFPPTRTPPSQSNSSGRQKGWSQCSLRSSLKTTFPSAGKRSLASPLHLAGLNYLLCLKYYSPMSVHWIAYFHLNIYICTREENVWIQLFLDIHITSIDGVHDHIGNPSIFMFPKLLHQVLRRIDKKVFNFCPVDRYGWFVGKLVLDFLWSFCSFLRTSNWEWLFYICQKLLCLEL